MINHPMWARWYQHKAEAATVLGGLVLAVLISVGGWLSYRSQATAQQDQSLHHGRQLALLLEVHTRDIIAGVDDALRRIQHEHAAKGGHLDLKQLIAGHKDIADYLAVVSVADAQGRLILSTLPLPDNVSIADLPHFKAHAAEDSGAPFFGMPVLGRVSGKWSFHVSRRLNRPDGAFDGVAVIAIDFSYWRRILHEGEWSNKTTVVLLGRDGRARAAHGPAAPELLRADWRFLARQAEVSGDNGLVDSTAADGVPGMWFYRAVSGCPLIVAVDLDRDALEQSLRTLAWNQAASAGRLLALLLLLTGLFLRYLVRQRRHEQDRARIAGVLQQSEERFRAVFDQADTAMGLRPVGRRDLGWQKVNRRYCELLGYTEEELLHLPASAITADHEQERAAQMDAAIASGEIQSYSREKPYRRKDGTTVWGLLTVSVLHYPDGQPSQVLSLVQDIDARKRSEAAVQESETRLRMVTEHIGEGLALYDPDDRLVFFNQTYRRLLLSATPDLQPGMTFGTLVRNRAQLLAARGEITDVEAFVADRLESHRNPRQQAIERKGPDGEVHLIREVHTPDGYIAVSFVDVTEQRAARAALEAEHNLLRTLIDNMPDLIHAKDAQRRYVLANAAWMRVRAPGFADVTGLSTDAIVQDRRRRAMIDAEDRAVLETGQSNPQRMETVNVPGLGERWFMTSKLPLRDAAGRVTGLIGINRDVTEIRRRTVDVEQLNAGLEQRVAERTAELAAANEELEAFASAVSHDLRTPLRHIEGFAGILLEDHGQSLGAEGVDCLRRIREATLRMSALIEDLLRLSRLMRGELKMTELDLAAPAREIIGELRREHPQRRVEARIGVALPARGDPGLLRAVLVNLLQNAWKFTARRKDAWIECGMTLREGVRVYYVRDNGAGFDMDYADRLFVAFQRLHHDSEFPGTGVGLATVRRIVRRHGGEIWAESVVNEGTTFYFTLGCPPADYGADVPAEVLRAAEPQPPAPACAVGTARVLLVDDDADVLMLAARALRPDGYDIVTASDGAEALALMRTQAPDIVISDFSMPGMNGARLLAQVAAMHADTLRLIVSGQTLNRAMQDGLRCGDIHYYFEKQHSYDPVRDCIRQWLAGRHRD